MERHEFVFDSLASHNPVVYNDSLLADFIDRFVKLSENVFTSKQFTAFDILDIFSDSLVVGHLGEQPINKNWIKQYLKVISLQVPPRFDSVAGFKRFVEENLAGSLLYKTGLKMGINETPPFRNKEAVYLAKKSHDLFEKLYIYEDIRPEKKDLSAFYENHKDSLYTVPKRVEVLEILVKDSTRADSLLEELRQGADFGDLAQKHSVRNIGKKNRGRIPAFKKSQYGSMGIAAFNMRNGELSGPFKIGKYYSVIKRLNVLPKSYKTMDQIRYRLLTDYRSVYTPEKRKKVYKILNKKYPYKINRNYFK